MAGSWFDGGSGSIGYGAEVTKKLWLGVGLTLVVGTVLSFRDYRAWRVAEMANYGHGSPTESGFAPAQDLGLPFESPTWRFRIKPPLGWQIDTDYQGLVKFVDPSGQVQIALTEQMANSDLTTEANRLATDITEDRQYLTVNGSSITVLTWVGPEIATQKAVLLHRGRLIVITATCPISAWKTYAKTFWSVYQSWTPV